MEKEIEQIMWVLKKYKQEHLLNGFDKLEDNKKHILLDLYMKIQQKRLIYQKQI